MAIIIEFPHQNEKFWRELVSDVTEGLTRDGFDQDAILWILTDLKPRVCALWMALDMESEVPSECLSALETLNGRYSTFMREILARAISEMLDLEKELYSARRTSRN